MKEMASDIDHTRVRKADFTSAYTLLRQREKRHYSNQEIRELPNLKRSSPHYKEWKMRSRSAQRLRTYLREKPKPLQILEVGCGNGWLSNKMASISGCNVVGIDPHGAEILQAKEVFKDVRGLAFIEKDLEAVSGPSDFDLIVFAASLQYFGDLHKTIRHCLGLLNSGGEIHILDTPFYSEEEIRIAALRSADHFDKLNVPGMTEYYHHHSRAELETYDPDILYSPSKWLNSLGFKRNPFPWIRIKK